MFPSSTLIDDTHAALESSVNLLHAELRCWDFASIRVGVANHTYGPQTKRPPGNRAASSSRENSSNGGLDRQNFLAKSYEPKTGVSRNFLENKFHVFNGLYTACQEVESASFSDKYRLLAINQ